MALRSTAARSERPIRRWISCVRPLCLPCAASRRLRSWAARGSMPYSAVTQPPPSFFHDGPRSSTLALQSTRVSPKLTRTEPSACLVKPRWMVTVRSWSGVRPEGRVIEDAYKLWARSIRRDGRAPYNSRMNIDDLVDTFELLG